MKTRKKAEAPEAFVAAVILTECYIVTRDRQPCTLINVSGMHKGGVLVPGAPVVTFSKPRDARRAMQRTEATREKLSDGMPEVVAWLRERFPDFLEGSKFEVVPCGHQVEPLPPSVPVVRRMPAPAPAMEMEEV